MVLLLLGPERNAAGVQRAVAGGAGRCAALRGLSSGAGGWAVAAVGFKAIVAVLFSYSDHRVTYWFNEARNAGVVWLNAVPLGP